jgi:hypothetical protein
MIAVKYLKNSNKTNGASQARDLHPRIPTKVLQCQLGHHLPVKETALLIHVNYLSYQTDQVGLMTCVALPNNLEDYNP